MRPTVGSQLVREYVYAYVAVCPAAGQMSSMILPWADTRLMSIFPAQTAARFPREHCVMFLDGAGRHTAHELTVPDFWPGKLRARKQGAMMALYRPIAVSTNARWPYLVSSCQPSLPRAAVEEVAFQ